MSRSKSQNGKPRICLVVACSQRKRLPVPAQLQLRSVRSRANGQSRRMERAASAVSTRLVCLRGNCTPATTGTQPSRRIERAKLYSSGAELWVISAGYGLHPRGQQVKPYSATFATRAADAVWRGPCDGDRLGST